MDPLPRMCVECQRLSPLIGVLVEHQRDTEIMKTHHCGSMMSRVPFDFNLASSRFELRKYECFRNCEKRAREKRLPCNLSLEPAVQHHAQRASSLGPNGEFPNGGALPPFRPEPFGPELSADRSSWLSSSPSAPGLISMEIRIFSSLGFA